MRSKTRVPVALALLLAVHVIALVADAAAPYPVDEQHRDLAYAPPTRLHFMDAAGRWHLLPFVHPLERVPGTFGQYREAVSLRSGLILFPRGTPYRVAGLIPWDRHLVGVDAPAHLFLLGTDRYGRDMLSRLLVGTRLSLFAGLLATLLALGIGTTVGTVSGFYGGRVDDALMWLANLFLSLPWIYLLLAVRTLLPLDLSPADAFLAVAALIGLIAWARPARLIRSVVLAGRDLDYVTAARSCGAGTLRILARHVLPQAGSVALTQAALVAPACVLAEITLSFLGLGVAEPTPSLGTLVGGLVPPAAALSHWWLAAPLAAMILLFALYERAATGVRRADTHAEVG